MNQETRVKLANELVKLAKDLTGGVDTIPLSLSRETAALKTLSNTLSETAEKLYESVAVKKHRRAIDKKQVLAWLDGIESRSRSLSAFQKTLSGLVKEMKKDIDSFGYEE